MALGCRLAGAGVAPGYKVDRGEAGLGCKVCRTGTDPACGEDGVVPEWSRMGQGGPLGAEGWGGGGPWMQAGGGQGTPMQDHRGSGVPPCHHTHPSPGMWTMRQWQLRTTASFSHCRRQAAML